MCHVTHWFDCKLKTHSAINHPQCSLSLSLSACWLSLSISLSLSACWVYLCVCCGPSGSWVCRECINLFWQHRWARRMLWSVFVRDACWTLFVWPSQSASSLLGSQSMEVSLCGVCVCVCVYIPHNEMTTKYTSLYISVVCLKCIHRLTGLSVQWERLAMTLELAMTLR